MTKIETLNLAKGLNWSFLQTQIDFENNYFNIFRLIN